MVTPFGPTARWTGVYLRGLAEGMEDYEARVHANVATGTKGKEFARCRLRGCTLTVPVEGGAHALKSGEPLPRLSEHGKWRREHEGALQTCYGKTPFYPHFMPEVAAIYAECEGEGLEQFNRAILAAALEWIEPEALTAPGLEGVRKETRAKVDADLSIFDVIFRLGKEGAFGL